MRPQALFAALAFLFSSAPALAAPASSITQYNITWTFDHEYETGQFATGDYWVVGPVTVAAVSPSPTSTRNGSCVNPRGGRQGYDDRGGEFATDDQVTFPVVLDPDQSLVSSVSKPEGVEIQNAGNMVSQAVLTVVNEPLPEGTLRPAYAGTYKRYFDVSEIHWERLPSLPVPDAAPGGAERLAEADRPRVDHLSSWTIQNSCAEENWNNGLGAHACYGREVSAYVSSAALYVLLDTPDREELALSMIQHGIDNYGVLRAGGNWAPNGGHHSGRKWPIVFAAALLDDCDMKQVGTDYDDSYFGEDGQTYYGAEGDALFGWDCGGGHGTYFEDGCSGGGSKDCRDTAGLVDGCPDYRNCCTSRYWVGQMLSTLILGGRRLWNHDPYFDYVDRWMNGEVEDADGSDAFTEAMWELYRDDLPGSELSPTCASQGGTPGSGGSSVGVGGTSGGGAGNQSGGSTSSAGETATDADQSGDTGGCGCRLAARSTERAPWFWILFLAAPLLRRRQGPRTARRRGPGACTSMFPRA